MTTTEVQSLIDNGKYQWVITEGIGVINVKLFKKRWWSSSYYELSSIDQVLIVNILEAIKKAIKEVKP